MSTAIAFLVFMACMLFLFPYSEIFPNRNLRRTILAIQSQQLPPRSGSSIIFNQIQPVLRIIIRVANIDGYAAKWKPIRESIKVLGMERTLTAAQFIAMKYLIALLLLGYMSILLTAEFTIEMMLLTLALGWIGYYLPDQWLKIRLKKRRLEIQNEIPSLLISLAVTTDAGLSLLQAIEIIISRRKGPLSTELRMTLQEIAVGIPQKEAFENLATRVLVEELTVFVSALVQTLEKGSAGITDVLREQANEAWNKRKSRAKELGEKASIKLFIPLISLILPALMIFLIFPSVFAILKFFV